MAAVVRRLLAPLPGGDELVPESMKAIVVLLLRSSNSKRPR